MTADGKPETQPSARDEQRSLACARRAAKASRRQTMLELVVSGYERAAIAEKFGVSLATVRREVEKAIDQRKPDAPQRYVRLQMARLSKALRLADDAIERGDLAGVDPLVKLVGALDRYHGLACAAPPTAPVEPRCLARDPAPLALTHAAPAMRRVETVGSDVAKKGA